MVEVVLTVVGVLVGGLGTYFAWQQVRIARQQRSLATAPPQEILEVTSREIGAGGSPTLAGGIDDTKYRRWLKGETGYIDIRGIGVAQGGGVTAIRFPLLELYTPLYARRGLSNVDLEQANFQRGQRIQLIEVAGAVRCLTVAGDPGTGKTTFLRHLAMLTLGHEQGTLPLYIRLADVHEFATKTKAQLSPSVFLDYLADVSANEELGLTRSNFDALARDGSCLWLLDSLDELPSEKARVEMVSAVETAADRWDKCRFALSSRPLALTGRAIPATFDLVVIDEMEDAEIRAFLDRWTRLLFVDAAEDTKRRYVGDLLSAIRDRPDIRSLAKNPVMLTCMAVVHFNDRHLPEGRADLLEAVVYWLIRAKRNEGAEPFTAKFVETVYRQLALAMFEIPEGRRYRVGRGFAAHAVTKLFDDGGEAAADFLAREELESGVLVRRGIGDISFWHPSFQEYLAAKEVAGRTDATDGGWWATVSKRLDETEWREVVALVPACLVRMGTERVDLFFDRLAASAEGLELPLKAKRMGLGGRIVSDLRVVGYEPKDVQRWAAVLSHVLRIFEAGSPAMPLFDRYEAAIAYGLGGDNRLLDFEATWVAVPGSTFLIGAQSRDNAGPNFDAEATRWEGPVIEVSFQPFEIRKYPVTVEEYARFVEAGGYSDDLRLAWSDEGWRWKTSAAVATPLDWEAQKNLLNCPVTGVSWFEAEAYCRWLTANDSRSREYSLPAEAEWEYSYRRHLPRGSRFIWGDSLASADDAEANWAGSNLRKKTPVGMFPLSNTPDGITDMIGNVEEWCVDEWSDNHVSHPLRGSSVERNETRRVLRGGSTIRFQRLCRSTYRTRIQSEKRYHTVGFRPVRRPQGA
jgi:formylglycine-generating enzyme required for sulfatase activity